MVREEYLNPEYMYKCINTLCRADNWVLSNFQFGRLEYKGFNQPILMRNNHTYNMVYKCDLYRLPKGRINYGKQWFCNGQPDNVELNIDDAESKLEKKIVYFDIRNECFVEHDDNIESFNAYPAFFNMDSQVYYAIYNQPRVMKHHYSNARNMNNLSRYMQAMNATPQNIFTFNELMYNMPGNKSHRVIDTFSGYYRGNYYFKTQKQANRAVADAVTGNHDYEHYKKLKLNWNDWKETDGFKLPLHADNIPYFYTNNVLELTLPIAEAVSNLAHNVYESLTHVNYAISMLERATQRLMIESLYSIYHRTTRERRGSDETWRWLQGSSLPWTTVMAKFPPLITPEMHAEDAYNSHIDSLNNAQKCMSFDLKRLGDLCKKIDKLQTASPSLDRMLEISNGLKLLDAECAAAELSAVQEKAKKTTRRKTR